jgi:hypothetical protein
MVEAIVAGALIAGGMAVLNRRQPTLSRGQARSAFTPIKVAETSPDLPCPWCMAATAETDDHCPSCRQPFG